MNLEYSFIAFKNAISPKLCDDIVKLGTNSSLIKGKVFNKKQSSSENRKYRESDIAFFDSSKWIMKEIYPYVLKANELAKWNFQLSGYESPQFTVYEKDQFYGWHADSLTNAYNQGEFAGKTRKLSVTLSLNNKEEYEGGEFQFCLTSKIKRKIVTCKDILKKGSLIIFPSFLLHQVKKVTKGKRYSLVVWNIGDPFK